MQEKKVYLAGSKAMQAERGERSHMLRGHADISKGTKLDCGGGQACVLLLAGQAVQKGVGGRVMARARLAPHRGCG